jgi:hypothetical protein
VVRQSSQRKQAVRSTQAAAQMAVVRPALLVPSPPALHPLLAQLPPVLLAASLAHRNKEPIPVLKGIGYHDTLYCTLTGL